MVGYPYLVHYPDIIPAVLMAISLDIKFVLMFSNKILSLYSTQSEAYYIFAKDLFVSLLSQGNGVESVLLK